MNKPVAWIHETELQDGTTVKRVTGAWELEYRYIVDSCDRGNPIPLYTQDQLEEARKLGMQQERALWNLAESTQEFESFDRTASHMAGEYVAHPVKELTQYDRGFDAGCKHIKKIYEAEIEALKAVLQQEGISVGRDLLNGGIALFRKAQEK